MQFTCPGIDSSGNAITNWTWTFGDGEASTAQNPLHVYTSAGAFQPALIATNILGATIVGVGPPISISQPPVVLSAPQIVRGTLSFQLSGPPGTGYVLQASSDLVSWIPLSTFTIPVGGGVTLTNTLSGYDRRFYRAYLP